MLSTAAIRRVFLEPKPSYPLREAARLLGLKAKELRGWIEAGELEPGEDEQIPWAEIVSFGMDLWSQEAVEAALGADLAEAIPELLRLTELEVRIPRLEVVALERVAARDGRAVDAVLARELLDFVSAEAEWLEGEIPGFAEALAWPDLTIGPVRRGGGPGGSPAASPGGTRSFASLAQHLADYDR